MNISLSLCQKDESFNVPPLQVYAIFSLFMSLLSSIELRHRSAWTLASYSHNVHTSPKVHVRQLPYLMHLALCSG